MKLLIKLLLMSLAINAYSYCELDQMDREMSSDRLYEIEKENAHLELFTQSIEDALHTENIIKRLRSRPEFAQVDNKKYKALLEQEFVNDEEKIRQIAELGSHLENLLDEANYSRLKTGASIPALPVGFMIASFYINKALKNSQTLGAVRKLVELFSNHKPSISEKRENRKKVGRVTLGAIVASVVSVGVQGYEFYELNKLNDYLTESLLLIEELLNGLPTQDEAITSFYNSYSDIEEYRELIDSMGDEYIVSIYTLAKTKEKLRSNKKIYANIEYDLKQCHD